MEEWAKGEPGELANINMPLGSVGIKIENWEKHILRTLHHLQLHNNFYQTSNVIRNLCYVANINTV